MTLQRIMGIDPGTARLGYALVDFDPSSNKQALVDCGIIETQKDLSQALRLKEIRADLSILIEEYQPQVFAVEQLFFFKNPKTIVPVAQARGVILEVAATNGLEVFEYTPLEMKKIITGHGMAEKSLVSTMIHNEFKLTEQIKPDDAVDAIGMALSYIRQDMPSLRAALATKQSNA
ncbi:MAG: crossover junction endodeoxyribonuclease RuvC [Candidatus Melainabacteria bacterium]|nr:crossover junction endodeoxyribonuclease RuvC [Candidatus Melainabacteria bacterium]